MTASSSETIPFHHTIVRGSLWMGSGFLGQQGIAVMRTLVLARLLTPEDFGLVGLVTLTLFAGLVLTEFGLDSVLIQRGDLSASFIHTAWTLMLLRGLGLFLALQVLAPWIAASFGRPEAEDLLRVGAVSFVLVGAPAITATLLARELRYRRRVLLDASRDVSGTVLAILLSLSLGNAWALLLGLLFGQAIAVILVWFVHPYRPRLVMDRQALAVYAEAGRHLYLSGLLTYVVTRGDDVAVGKLRGVQELGQYQVVFAISEMLTRGLSDMLAKVVFPAYARIAAEGRRLTEAFEEVWCVLLLLLLPICAFMVVFPRQIVGLLLGDKWTPAAAAFAVLAVAETLRALAAACGSLILAAGRTAYLPRIKLVEAACFALLIVPLTTRWGLVGAAGCVLAMYCLSLAGHLYGAQRVAPVGTRIARGLPEPLAVTLALAILAWRFCPDGDLPAVVGIGLWTAVWVLYVRVRHAGLVRKISDAIQGRVSTVAGSGGLRG
jgi:O-antigen/teichoic acid export membrane protein